MVESLTPQSSLLWEIGAKLYADSGEIDATLLSEQDWSAMRQAAADMRAVSLALQSAPPQVAAPGAKLQGEEGGGALSAAQIQALIDAEPEAFAAEAGKLVEVAEGFLTAIEARDGAAIDELSGRLNEACSACHLRFWFPDQAAQYQ